MELKKRLANTRRAAAIDLKAASFNDRRGHGLVLNHRHVRTKSVCETHRVGDREEPVGLASQDAAEDRLAMMLVRAVEGHHVVCGRLGDHQNSDVLCHFVPRAVRFANSMQLVLCHHQLSFRGAASKEVHESLTVARRIHRDRICWGLCRAASKEVLRDLTKERLIRDWSHVADQVQTEDPGDGRMDLHVAIDLIRLDFRCGLYRDETAAVLDCEMPSVGHVCHAVMCSPVFCDYF